MLFEGCRCKLKCGVVVLVPGAIPGNQKFPAKIIYEHRCHLR